MNFRKVIETYGYPLVSKEVSGAIEKSRNNPDGYAAQKFVNGSPYHQKYGDRWMLTRWKYLLDSPYKVSDKCCYVMKKAPARKYETETGRKPITGMMAAESNLRKTRWMKSGCNAFDNERPISNPLSFWTEQDILEYIVKNNLAYAPVYGNIIHTDQRERERESYHTTACQRTGCVFCAYGEHLEKGTNRFQRLKVTHPKLWNYCMKPWDEGGLGMREVLEYINVKVE